jgi:diaminopimelate decarboxylase
MDITPRNIAEIAVAAYKAAGFQVSEINAGGGRFARYDIRDRNTGAVFSIQIEEN